jgi:hypothetical protein
MQREVREARLIKSNIAYANEMSPKAQYSCDRDLSRVVFVNYENVSPFERLIGGAEYESVL